MAKVNGATLMARNLKEHVSIHPDAGRKPQQFGWLTT